MGNIGKDEGMDSGKDVVGYEAKDCGMDGKDPRKEGRVRVYIGKIL